MIQAPKLIIQLITAVGIVTAKFWYFDSASIADTEIDTTDDNGDDVCKIVAVIITDISLLIKQKK